MRRACAASHLAPDIGVLRAPSHALCVVRALAAEPKPDFSIKTKSIEASVILDAKIKADPALAANCLAEGRKWAEKNRAEADKERKQDPELFRNGPWTMERKYETRSVVDGRYVSIVRGDYEYTGGAHPNRSSDTILWDRSGGQTHQHPSVLHRDGRQRPDAESDAARRHCIARGREEEARRGRHGCQRHRSHRAKASQDRRRCRWRHRPRKARAPA